MTTIFLLLTTLVVGRYLGITGLEWLLVYGLVGLSWFIGVIDTAMVIKGN